jgi:hypothetical protein
VSVLLDDVSVMGDAGCDGVMELCCDGCVVGVLMMV